MKNKTKLNMKRVLLFFIPLCLIVGMLAVPAFATPSLLPLQEYFQQPTEELQIALGDYDPADVAFLDGRSAVIVESDFLHQLTLDRASGYYFDTDEVFNYDVVLFDSQYNVLNYNMSGVSYLDANNETWYFLLNTSYPLSSGMALSGDSAYVGFVFSSYPPEFLDEADTVEYEVLNAADFVTLTFDQVTPDPDLPVDDGGEGDTSGIFAVWSEITDWIINGLKSATNAFYYNGQLTLLGYLCIIPLALGVALLLISIVQKILHLRG